MIKLNISVIYYRILNIRGLDGFGLFLDYKKFLRKGEFCMNILEILLNY